MPSQNFPLNVPTKRRLCSTVGWRIVEGWAAHCFAFLPRRFRAATMTNFARSSLAFVPPALFGAAKSCALVNLFMIQNLGENRFGRRSHVSILHLIYVMKSQPQ